MLGSQMVELSAFLFSGLNISVTSQHGAFRSWELKWAPLQVGQRREAVDGDPEGQQATACPSKERRSRCLHVSIEYLKTAVSRNVCMFVPLSVLPNSGLAPPRR